MYLDVHKGVAIKPVLVLQVMEWHNIDIIVVVKLYIAIYLYIYGYVYNF